MTAATGTHGAHRERHTHPDRQDAPVDARHDAARSARQDARRAASVSRLSAPAVCHAPKLCVDGLHTHTPKAPKLCLHGLRDPGRGMSCVFAVFVFRGLHLYLCVRAHARVLCRSSCEHIPTSLSDMCATWVSGTAAGMWVGVRRRHLRGCPARQRGRAGPALRAPPRVRLRRTGGAAPGPDCLLPVRLPKHKTVPRGRPVEWPHTLLTEKLHNFDRNLW
jgi:hypothetical protein